MRNVKLDVEVIKQNRGHLSERFYNFLEEYKDKVVHLDESDTVINHHVFHTLVEDNKNPKWVFESDELLLI